MPLMLPPSSRNSTLLVLVSSLDLNAFLLVSIRLWKFYHAPLTWHLILRTLSDVWVHHTRCSSQDLPPLRKTFRRLHPPRYEACNMSSLVAAVILRKWNNRSASPVRPPEFVLLGKKWPSASKWVSLNVSREG
ncbi:uncharacterized protein BJ212DRAFT_760870 [Suillus subaureus]|uniref:Uncharacterized protein n=1 Tax=Suillus subaureus TaxID=48587 RepID=A0A9P7E0B1_9AGAM|nr:uncharacterized protein BJ212DRAFT_760870 [Suillus subaureus]KAG1807336.1 hypothetical protein BJ212DRAFT_760870 [Suillus subaureus]